MSKGLAMTDASFRAAGQWLFDQHARRAAFEPLEGALLPATMAGAYDVQDALVERLSTAGAGLRIGHKIALTTPQMRAFVRHDDSIAGQVLAGRVFASPARVSTAPALHFGFECEIAFRVGRDTDPGAPPTTREAMSAYIDAAAPAFELIDDRNADYARFGADGGAPARSLAADNAWNDGAVIGPWVADWRGLDLGAACGVARINGNEVGRGHGRDVLGHPLDAMLWIARHLASRGQGLRAGEFVITGSLVTSKFPRPGDRVAFAVDGLGEVVMDVAP